MKQWKEEMIAGIGLYRPWFVLFQPLVLNVTGFDYDDDVPNEMAFLTVFTVYCYF